VNFMFSRESDALDVKDDYRDSDDGGDETGREVSKADSSYRVSTYYHKEYVKGGYLIRADSPLDKMVLTGKLLSTASKMVEEIGDEKLSIRTKKPNGEILMLPVMNKTRMVGEVLLSHEEDIFNGVALFPVVRYAPYYSAGYEYGIVENIIGTQEQINWSWSMELNLIKQLANTGWRIARGAGSKIKAFLRDHGSEDGVIIDESEGGGKVEKLEPNQFPVGYDIITDKGARNMQIIANVRTENPEFDQKNMSGRAIALKQNASFTGSAPIFATWDKTLEIFALTLSSVLDRNPIYSEAEIRLILDETDLIDSELLSRAKAQIAQMLQARGIQIPQQPPAMPVPEVLAQMQPNMRFDEDEDFQVEQQAFQEMQQQIEQMARPLAIEMLMTDLRKSHIGKYGTKVSLAPHAQTFRMAQSAEAMELHKTLMESGMPGLSRAKLINMSDLSEKEELIADVPQAPMQAAG